MSCSRLLYAILRRISSVFDWLSDEFIILIYKSELMIIHSSCPPAIRSLYVDQLSGFVSELYYFESIESTNTFLAQLKEKALENTDLAMDSLQSCAALHFFIVCIAEQQTKGRGRGAHVWHASHQDIFFSLRFTLLPSQLEGLSLCVALLCVRTLEQLGFNGLAIKWPNDIFFAGKKCGGILIESLYQCDQVTVIVGVGLNVASQLHESVKNHASSLYDLMIFHGYSKEQLRVSLIKGLVEGMSSGAVWRGELDSQKHVRSFLATHWPVYDFCWGKKIKVTNGSHEWLGVMQGIDDEGNMLLRTESDLVKICAGSLMLLG
jgi:BirA family biotin operon repressor/biotin-[acetyl-CoA-carboxylase] ligase